MSYICHKSIWSILVSKRPSGPQKSHPFIRFWLTNCLKIKINKKALEIFSLYKAFLVIFGQVISNSWHADMEEHVNSCTENAKCVI